MIRIQVGKNTKQWRPYTGFLTNSSTFTSSATAPDSNRQHSIISLFSVPALSLVANKSNSAFFKHTTSEQTSPVANIIESEIHFLLHRGTPSWVCVPPLLWFLLEDTPAPYVIFNQSTEGNSGRFVAL